MPDPLLSVVVPVYNVELYVKACLESVLKQDYRNLEVLVINDGSTDGSLAICQHLASQDSRIRLFSQENRGLGAARNRGMAEARGQYLHFLDSDDSLTSKRIYGKCIRIIQQQSLDLVYFRFRVFAANPLLKCRYSLYYNRPFVGLPKNRAMDITRENLLESLIGLTSSACNKIFRRDFTQGLRFPEHRLVNEDEAFHALTLSRFPRYALLTTAAYGRLVRKSSITSQLRQEGASRSFAKQLDILNVFEFALHNLRVGRQDLQIQKDVYAYSWDLLTRRIRDFDFHPDILRPVQAYSRNRPRLQIEDFRCPERYGIYRRSLEESVTEE